MNSWWSMNKLLYCKLWFCSNNTTSGLLRLQVHALENHFGQNCQSFWAWCGWNFKGNSSGCGLCPWRKVGAYVHDPVSMHKQINFIVQIKSS